MYLDYAAIPFDKDGRIERPALMLCSLSGDALGVLSGVSNLQLTVKFSEASEMTFDIAKTVDGEENPLYAAVSGHKLIRTEHFGVYVTSEPQTTADGVREAKSVTCYSIEKRLEDRQFFIEEGTFNFYDPSNLENTVMGRILEKAPEWKIGEVSSSLIGKYRTFDEYSDTLYSFIGGDATEKFRCLFVFDPYAMTISVYDADEERSVLPIYLDFDNLVSELNITELSGELVTAMRPYGADGLSIYDVNPTGSNWIYDISHFIENGDIDAALSKKWRGWETEIQSNRARFSALTALRAGTTAALLAKQAEQTEVAYEIESLRTQQNVTIETLAKETTDAGKESQQKALDGINAALSEKNAEKAAVDSEIAALNAKLSGSGSYGEQIEALVAELAMENYFTADELSVLEKYFVEQEMTDETFVASDVDTAVSGVTQGVVSGSICVSGSTLQRIDMTEPSTKTIYTMAGGKLAIDALSLTCDIIRASAEVSGGRIVMSAYVGTLSIKESTLSSGLVTISADVGSVTSDAVNVTTDDITECLGSALTTVISNGSVYITVNVSEYQKYAVQEELYQYAAKTLSDVATPTYEFTVEGGNFIFAKEFAPFRDTLKLGCGIYLRVSDERVITPNLIEFSVDFEDESSFSMIFSSRFKRQDSVNTLRDMIETGYSSGRSFDAAKYIYNRTSGKMSQVTQFINGALDAAVNAIIGAANQSVRIDGAGIEVGGDDGCKFRIVNNMIALTDDNWQHAKVALGRFATDDGGTYFGVHADVIGGKLVVGNNLVIENEQVDEDGNPTGVMQFKVDSTGAWLNNSTFVLQKDSGGRILLDPRWGIAGGSSLLFETSGTTVTPKFVDEDGDLILDSDNMPENANFYFDINTGNAYFRGKVYATDGVFNGTVYATDGEFTGKVTATSGSFKGAIYAESGEFKGKVNATGFYINGDNALTTGNKIASNYLDLGNIQLDGTTGNISMTGNLNLSGVSSITWGSNNPKQDLSSYATKTYVDNNKGLNANEVDSAISTYIDNTSITAEKLQGRVVNMLDRWGDVVGNMTIADTTTGDGISINTSYGGFQVYSGGNVYFSAGSGGNLTIQSNRVQLGYAALCLSSTYGYGSSLPNSGVYGQIFFLKQ